MKTFQNLAIASLLLLLTGCFAGIKDSSFEGTWKCTEDTHEVMKITNIGKNTYELDFGKDVAFSGEVNDDGVLVVEMMGNISRLSIDGSGLHFSGILAPCKDYIKE
ncbi:hypothetical protein [Robertkochia solimangrovi]|uniref:hypothetical protein n=1 Tax=Robertkochia solimangrovi TaxID=2213046 RepID=UPI00117DEA86|nr:hypothetical protein [Robertkochia solimangrovi]TRZ46241.1 hypothetical protein DMZ48_03005 [Robertkochia solimangrovi]